MRIGNSNSNGVDSGDKRPRRAENRIWNRAARPPAGWGLGVDNFGIRGAAVSILRLGLVRASELMHMRAELSPFFG